MGLDLRLEQVINDRMADFSTAVTFPHIMSDPRLPGWGATVSRQWWQVSEHEIWNLCQADYLLFNTMICKWNYCVGPGKEVVFHEPGSYMAHGYDRRLEERRRQNLKRTGEEKAWREYVYADPRLPLMQRRSKSAGGGPKEKVRLRDKAVRWYKNEKAEREVVKKLKGVGGVVTWGFQDGRFFIMGGEYGLEQVNGKMIKVPPRPLPGMDDQEKVIMKRSREEEERLDEQEEEENRARQKARREAGEDSEDSGCENEIGRPGWLRMFANGKK